MKNLLLSRFLRAIVGIALGLIGCLGFTSCHTRQTKLETNERSDSTTVTKPRPISPSTGMVMYGTPTTTFQQKQIVTPEDKAE